MVFIYYIKNSVASMKLRSSWSNLCTVLWIRPESITVFTMGRISIMTVHGDRCYLQREHTDTSCRLSSLCPCFQPSYCYHWMSQRQ